MIQAFVDRFMEKKDELRGVFYEKHPDEYLDIVKAVVSVLSDEEYGDMDITRIHVIDDGDYQGTLVFVIAEIAYQPHKYWYVRVSYGSCSGCDTLKAIRGYGEDDKPTKEQVDDYMQLALHIVQGIKKMGDDDGGEPC